MRYEVNIRMEQLFTSSCSLYKKSDICRFYLENEKRFFNEMKTINLGFYEYFYSK